jgi:hypothetical protein
MRVLAKGRLSISAALAAPRATARFVREMYKKPQTEEYLQRITAEAMHTPTNTAIALDAWVARDRAPLLAKVDKPTLIVASSYGGDLPLKSQKKCNGEFRGHDLNYSRTQATPSL